MYDPAIVQAVWNRADGSATGPDQYSLQAVRNAIAGQGATFRQLYASFAVWNRIPALRYSEGAAYPAARAQGFAVGRRHPSTGWLGLRLKHLSSYYGTFVAGTTAPAVGHLTVNVDAPNLSLGPEARLIVRFKSGAVSVKRFLLGPLGKGTLRVGFDRAAVARVDIVLSNAGTAVSCGRNTVYSCQGTFTSENGLYLFRAFIS